jgi:hypothetical protein
MAAVDDLIGATYFGEPGASSGGKAPALGGRGLRTERQGGVCVGERCLQSITLLASNSKTCSASGSFFEGKNSVAGFE